MALQKANKSSNTTPHKFEKAGDNLKGYYQGQSEKTINGSPAIEHVYKTKDGLKSVLGQANILNQLKQNNITLGTYVEIEFSGQVQKLKGNRTMKVYDVSYDRDDVDTSEAGSVGNADDDDGIDDSDSDTDDTTTAYTPPPATARTPQAPPSAERQARVRDLLKGRATQS